MTDDKRITDMKENSSQKENDMYFDHLCEDKRAPFHDWHIVFCYSEPTFSEQTR